MIVTVAHAMPEQIVDRSPLPVALLGCALVALLCGQDSVATTSVQSIAAVGDQPSLQLLHDPPDSRAEFVVLMIPVGGGRMIDASAGSPTYGADAKVAQRLATSLKRRGVAIVAMSTQSSTGRPLVGAERSGALRRAISAVVEIYPWAGVHLLAFGDGASVAFEEVQERDPRVAGVVLFGGFYKQRLRRTTSGAARILMLHAVNAMCDAGSIIEAREVAQESRASLVEFAFDSPSPLRSCGQESQHALWGYDADAATTILAWLDGREVAPQRFGPSNALPPWREEVVFLELPSTFGSDRVEVTLYWPTRGTAPYPLAVFAHGDIDPFGAIGRSKERIRQPSVAWTMADMGFVVAVPARRGVARSTGRYRNEFSRDDGDATYKARHHAAEILAVIDLLRARPQVDGERVVLLGHSAGGYAATYCGSRNPPWLKAVVNLAGGRTQSAAGQVASGVNRMMVDGFQEMGRTARVPLLGIFAENDSRYSADTIRASLAAYQKAGAPAALLLLPPLVGDGHQIQNFPALWRAQLRDFLQAAGVLGPRQSTTTYSPSAYASLGDEAALPASDDTVKRAYRQFLAAPRPRAFSLSTDGAHAFDSGSEDPATEALAACFARRPKSPCGLYAVDDEVVWRAPAGR